MNRTKLFKPATALLIIALALYANTTSYDFSLDDSYHLLGNDEVKLASYSIDAFSEPTWPGNLYRPLLSSSLALTYAAFGANPIPYHLTNAAIYALCVVFAFLLLADLLSLRTAFISALLFAVHPIHVEAVANVSHRTELLAFLFGLSALHFAMRAAMRASLFDAIVSFAAMLLSLLSKESALAFVPLLLCALTVVKQRQTIKLPVAAATAALIVYLILRINALGSIIVPGTEVFFVVNPLASLPASARIENALILLGHYIYLMIFPASLTHDYSFAKTVPISNFLDPNVIMYLTLLATMALLGAYGLFKKNPIWFWPAWFFISIAIQSNLFFPIGTVFAERLAFTPSLAVCALAGISAASLSNRTLQLTLTCLVTAILSGKTLVQSSYWRSNTTLHTQGIVLSPASAKAQQNYAIVLMNNGKFPEAISQLKKALAIYPNYGDAAFRIGLCYEAMQQQDSAQEWFYRAQEIQPQHTASRNALGWRLIKQQNFNEAKPLFDEVTRIDPENFRAKLGLYAIAVAKDDMDVAASYNNWLYQNKPNDKAYQLWRKVFIAKLRLRSQTPHSESTSQGSALLVPDGESPGAQQDEHR